MKFIIISIVAFVAFVIAMIFLKVSFKKKTLILALFLLLYGLFCVSYLPKKLVIKDGVNTYIALELGTKEINDDAVKDEFINIIKNIKLYKGDKRHGVAIQDLTSINIVSDNMSLSGKKVASAYFYMRKGHTYGIVDIDQKSYYFHQKALYDAVNQH